MTDIMGIGRYPCRTEAAVVEVVVIVASSENSTEAVQQV